MGVSPSKLPLLQPLPPPPSISSSFPSMCTSDSVAPINTTHLHLYAPQVQQAVTRLLASHDSVQHRYMSLGWMARVAGDAARYEDMCKVVRELVLTRDATVPPSSTERNLVLEAYAGVIGPRRTALQTLRDTMDNPDDALGHNILVAYRAQIASELKSVCQEAMELVRNHMATHTKPNTEAHVLDLKMCADYARYIVECTDDPIYSVEAATCYQQAATLAAKLLEPTHPTRLSVALNQSVFLFDTMNQRQDAIRLAKVTFDQAMIGLHHLSATTHTQSVEAMKLIRDNIIMWSANDEDDDGCLTNTNHHPPPLSDQTDELHTTTPPV